MHDPVDDWSDMDSEDFEYYPSRPGDGLERFEGAGNRIALYDPSMESAGAWISADSGGLVPARR